MLEKTEAFWGRLAWLAFMAAATIFIAGCQSEDTHFTDVGELTRNATNTIHNESIVLREGDELKLTFPTASSFNTPKITIMRDGTITLPVVGVVHAAGKTPAQLQDELINLYSKQIESRQITVELISATFPVFVTGAVLKPGKVLSDRPLTALQAIMEAGGPDYTRANLKSITVLRRDNGHLVKYALNLKAVFTGDADDQFYMKPDDIIYVRERFNWF